MNKNGGMNETITIDGKEYEVLPLDDFKGTGNQPDHARLSSGKVVEVNFDNQHEEFYCRFGNGIPLSCWEDLGIQPLKLLPKKPLEFVGEAEWLDLGYEDVEVLRIRVPKSKFPNGFKDGMKFRCVEVTE